jgi:type VI secretion system protein ImpL
MFSFFKRRAFLVLIGLLLVAVFIWYAGPYFAFASYRPLETETSRLIAILIVVGCWTVARVVKWLRASRASDVFMSAVLRQAHPDKDRPSAEVSKLRERFEQATASLRQQRRSGITLYDLPWYVFIGAPGSGKTTALLNAGLRFPLEQRVGKGAVRGVGGTRNCDWWFTSEAVFLDTAGRYTTQDSDPSSDSEGWKEFLALLRTYRKRRPLNGVVLTISVPDLMTAGEADREAHVEALRHRLDELTRELQIDLPVYLMVTKCDTVPGFSEYFDDLTQDGRAQVWGVTFPYEQTMTGRAADAFDREFDALLARLNARAFARLEQERGIRRRAAVFAFPQQMASLREPLVQFVSEVFSSTNGDRQTLLRGVYLTSGTQDGTQIDRLLGAIGRRFGVSSDVIQPAPGRGKAFFIERLLKQVVIGESGLAGVNRRLELKQAAWQIAAYVAIVLTVGGGIVALSISYSLNRAYVAQVASDVAMSTRVRPTLATRSAQAFLPYLTVVRSVSDSANRYRDETPWGMRWGLYQGTSVGNDARDAYRRELDSILLPRFAALVRQRLVEHASEPEQVYVYLKAYLMLGEPRHLDKKYLQSIADVEWGTENVGRSSPSLATHFASLLDYSDTLRPMPLDPALVAQARTSIRPASVPQIMYVQLQRAYSSDVADVARLDVIALGIEKVLRRKSGRRLSAPIPSLYTQKVFKEVTGTGMLPLVKRFADDEWVWGTGGVSLASWPRLTAQVTDIYEHDYSRTWDALLADLEVVPFSSVQQYADALSIVVGPTSPLKSVMKTAVENTTLVTTSDAAGTGAPPSLSERITGSAKDMLNRAEQKITGVSNAPAGTFVTQHFQPIHRLMAGQPAPFDGVLDQIRKIRDQLVKLGPQVGGEQPLRALVDPAIRDQLTALKQDAANLPTPIDSLVAEFARRAEERVGDDARLEVETRYDHEVVANCTLRIGGRYPFGNGNDVSLAEFAEVFGPGGVYDKFFGDRLEKLVDTTQHPWTWRAGSGHPSLSVLRQFEQADRIRQMFFTAGSKAPEVNFFIRLTSVDPTATRFYVSVDGQRFAAGPGADSARSPVIWPGPDKSEYVIATFEDRIAPAEQARGSANGPWGMLHLIDATALPADLAASDSSLTLILDVKTRYHTARVTLDSSSAASNPFTAHEWRQFRCEP